MLWDERRPLWPLEANPAVVAQDQVLHCLMQLALAVRS